MCVFTLGREREKSEDEFFNWKQPPQGKKCELRKERRDWFAWTSPRSVKYFTYGISFSCHRSPVTQAFPHERWGIIFFSNLLRFPKPGVGVHGCFSFPPLPLRCLPPRTSVGLGADFVWNPHVAKEDPEIRHMMCLVRDHTPDWVKSWGTHVGFWYLAELS